MSLETALSCLDGARGSRAVFDDALVVGAVMSSAFEAETKLRGPDVVRWSFAPITGSRLMASSSYRPEARCRPPIRRDQAAITVTPHHAAMAAVRKAFIVLRETR